MVTGILVISRRLRSAEFGLKRALFLLLLELVVLLGLICFIDLGFPRIVKSRNSSFDVTNMGSFLGDIRLESARFCLLSHLRFLGLLIFYLNGSNFYFVVMFIFLSTGDLRHLCGHLGAILGSHLIGLCGHLLRLLVLLLLLHLRS